MVELPRPANLTSASSQKLTSAALPIDFPHEETDGKWLENSTWGASCSLHDHPALTATDGHDIPAKKTDFGRLWVASTIARHHSGQAAANSAQNIVHRLAAVGTDQVHATVELLCRQVEHVAIGVHAHHVKASNAKMVLVEITAKARREVLRGKMAPRRYSPSTPATPI